MTNYLIYLKDEIHSVILATTDDNHNPVTCVIDMMLADENGLYFLTAKGKAFYTRLKNNENISLTGMKGEDTMSSKSITIRGKAREVGSDLLDKIFMKNQYMNEIYPNLESRSALTVFQIYEGDGEFFDLSVRPIFREGFSFGKTSEISSGYVVMNGCDLCKKCMEICPQNCIDIINQIARINQKHCLNCGICVEVCPNQAIRRLTV